MAVHVQFTVSYMDTLTEGGYGRLGERVAVGVQYTYCHSYCVLHGYSDRGEVEESVAVRVPYTYCHSYCVLHRYSDRGNHLHCVWLLYHMIVI